MKKLFLTLVLIITIIICFLFWNNHRLGQKQQANEHELYLKMQESAADMFRLEIANKEEVRSSGEEIYILSTTSTTERIMGRWERVSNSIDEIDFPDEAFQKEEWVEVMDVFLSNESIMREKSLEIAENENEEFFHESISYYILYDSQPEDTFTLFQEVFEEKYLD